MINRDDNIIHALEKLAFRSISSSGMTNNIPTAMNPNVASSEISRNVTKSTVNQAKEINKKARFQNMTSAPKVSSPGQKTAIEFLNSLKAKP